MRPATLLATGECPNGAADADGAAGCAGQGTWPDDPDGIAEPLPNALRAAQRGGWVPAARPDLPTAPALSAIAGDGQGGQPVVDRAVRWRKPDHELHRLSRWMPRGPPHQELTTIGPALGYSDTDRA